jgi:large conductance mechanosensitive channel
MKKIFSEFKKFAMRGNVLDMAVGVIIGAAFGKIVDSLVKEIIMPPLGLLISKVDFTNMYFLIKEGTAPAPYASLDAAKAAGAVTINIGLFMNAVISFTIVAFAVFMLITLVNKLDKKKTDEAPAAPTTKKCPYCCSDIPLDAVKCPHCTSDLKE